ncbi:hypothetical protein OIU76_021148 [Salix suchowensis]|nr:hypothetical protein OIU76_021148 [Salix suchowensis]
MGNPDFQAAAASAEGLQTLVLMNPTYVQYSNIPPPPPSNNLVFLNAAASNSLSATPSPLVPRAIQHPAIRWHPFGP